MRLVRELVLWAGAALGLLAVAAGLAVAFGGFGFLIFRSGSMSPEIPTGGIALSRTVEASDIGSGDVVSVVAANGERITHRVVSSTLRDGEATLVLKGDANTSEDSELYVVSTADRVVTSVPFGGYAVAHALTPPGLVALASLSLMLMVLTGGRDVERLEPRAPRRRPQHRDRSRVQRGIAPVLLLLLGLGAGAAAANSTGTMALFTDSPQAATGTFGARTLGAPGGIGCQGGVLGVFANVSWTAPSPGVDSYQIAWVRGTATGTASVTSGTSWRPTGLPDGRYSVSVRSADGLWTSAAAAGPVSITAATGLLGQYFTC